MAAGFAQIPGLTTEGVIGLLLFYVIGFAFEKAKIPVFIKRLRRKGEICLTTIRKKLQ